MKTIKLREWKYRGALKNAIARFLKAHPRSDQLDVADAVRIGLKDAHDVMDEMVKDRRIRRAKYAD